MTPQNPDQPPCSPACNPVELASLPPRNPDHAWKLLSLVNEWIRHADAKATATLAFTGALGTLLYNLVKSQTDRTLLLNVTSVFTCLFLGLAMIFCGLTLAPRIRDHDADPEIVNRIFFGSISTNYEGKRPDYRAVLKTLTEDPEELIGDLADQIHSNARIASRKNRWVKWAIRSILIAGALLGLVAALVAN